MPNLLVRSLKYVADALNYARSGRSSGQRNPIATKIMSNASRSGFNVNQANVDFFAQLAVTNPAFMAGIDKITNRVGDPANLVVQRLRSGVSIENADGDDESQWEDWLDHQFLEVLASPNSIMPGFLLLAETAMWMNTYGNAFWFLATDEIGVGPINEIYPLQASACYPDPTTLRISAITGKLTIDYRYTLGAQILLPGESVIHFRTPNLFDYWQGMAKLSSLQQSLSMDIGESKYLNSFFEESNAVPSAIVSVPREVTDDEMRIIERDLQENFGARRATLVARAGEMDAKVIQHTIEEMQVLQGMDFNSKRIQDVLGVPTGLSSASSGTARLAAEIAFAKDVTQPLLNAIASFINYKISPMYALPGQMRIVAQNVIPQDTAIEVAEYNAYRAEETINGNRKKRNLKPLKLTGPLAKYQQYIDELPLEILHEVMAAEMSAQQPTESPAMAFSGAGLANPALAAQSVQQRNGVPAQRRMNANNTKPKLGYRRTGQQEPQVMLNDMLKSVLLPEELETLNKLM